MRYVPHYAVSSIPGVRPLNSFLMFSIVIQIIKRYARLMGREEDKGLDHREEDASSVSIWGVESLSSFIRSSFWCSDIGSRDSFSWRYRRDGSRRIIVRLRKDYLHLNPLKERPSFSDLIRRTMPLELQFERRPQFQTKTNHGKTPVPREGGRCLREWAYYLFFCTFTGWAPFLAYVINAFWELS